jgi:probable F420-dependent oxidoreductase
MPRTIAIGLGLQVFPFNGAAGYWRWVDMCESGGVDSIWQTDRIISPEPMLEAVTTMAALAGRTRRMKFGFNVLSLALRDPILVAKQCATVDVLSQGRLLPAFGIGSPLGPEWAALNIDTKTRGKRTDEALEIIHRLWREAKVDFEGPYHKLTAAAITPRPVQPDLPMWIGGSSEAAIRRTAKYGTGWQAGIEDAAKVAPVVAAIRTAVAAAGRHIDEDHYGAAFPFRFGTPDDPGMNAAMEAYRKRTDREPRNYFAIGDATTIVNRIAEYVDAGISKLILRPAARGDEDMLAQTKRVIDEVLPQVAARWPRPAKRAAAE